MVLGVRKRKHSRLVPFMHLCMLLTLVSFLQIFATGMMGLVWAAMVIFLGLYLLSCIYALYEKFKKETLRGFHLETTTAEAKVNHETPKAAMTR